MQRNARLRILRTIASLMIVAGVTAFYRKTNLHVNQTTVALSLLLAILAVSAAWGMAVSALMSVAAMLAFNYFFLPPFGRFTVADPQNWVALAAFLMTAIVGSQLSSRIRKAADVADRRRKEIEQLYAFSQKLLGEGNVIQLLNAIPNHIVESFEAGAASVLKERPASEAAPSAAASPVMTLRRPNAMLFSLRVELPSRRSFHSPLSSLHCQARVSIQPRNETKSPIKITSLCTRSEGNQFSQPLPSHFHEERTPAARCAPSLGCKRGERRK